MELKQIPDTSKVWIFASQKTIEKKSADEILNHLSAFLSKWKAHGKELKSYKEIVDGHFLIIVVDEAFEQATGCSIDSLVHFIREIEKKYNLNLSDRSLVFYRANQEIKSLSFLKVKDHINAGIIDENTLIYNNSIINGAELKDKWVQKAGNSWIKKYFQKSTVK